MREKFGVIASACVLVLIGIASGWYAARQGSGGAAEADPHADDAAAAAAGLSEQALKNIGVTIGPAKLSTFVRTVRVQATVVDSPLNDQPIPALLGGFVTRIHVRPGQVVEPGAPLATVARAAIPRPKLELASEILDPVSEDMHKSISALRTSMARLRIRERELARVKKFSDTSAGADELPVVPRARLLELEYARDEAKQESDNAERELAWHGLSPEEIDALRAGAPPPPTRSLWRRALEQNGLWGEHEREILGSLPEHDREGPWVIATIGELSAAGLATPELTKAMTETPAMGERFFEVASLLLDGHSVGNVAILAGLGALDPVVVLRAPTQGGHNWDVTDVPVSRGQRVEPGDVVVVLHDARTMWLRLEAAGEEIAALANSISKSLPLTAEPLVPGAGPSLTGLRIDRLETHADADLRGTVGIIRATNTPIRAAGSQSRSWGLRIGLRYLVDVPVQTLKDRFVLPAGAVTSEGAERIVFLEDGTTFEARPVHVEYEDDRVAVIAHDGAIYPDDIVVLTGAFALGLALQAGSSAVDPHAGHNH